MMFNKYLVRKLSFSLLFFLISPFVVGQSETAGEGIEEGYLNFIILLFVALIVLVFVLLFIFGMNKEQVEEEDAELNAANEKPKLIKKIQQKLNRSTYVEEGANMLSDNEYKGNRKLNKKFLFWFKTILVSTVIFLIIYFSYYEIFRGGLSHMQGHNMMMTRTSVVQKEAPVKTDDVLNENTLTVLKDKPSLDRGKEIFNTNCAACHRTDAGGLVGPNLTDDYWINGGGIKNIVKTITNGVPEKGMISWKGILNQKQIQETASYIISLHGTNPSNPKPPQGEKYIGE